MVSRVPSSGRGTSEPECRAPRCLAGASEGRPAGDTPAPSGARQDPTSNGHLRSEGAMTAAGWVFLIGSWAAILGLTAFCVARLLRPKPPP